MVVACSSGSTDPEFSTLSITTASLPTAAPTVAYSQTLAATGGDGSYAWSISAGDSPTGLSLTPGGVLAGTPTGSSTSFSVQVVSGDGQTAERALAVTVNEVLSISTSSLPGALVGEAYGEGLTATGGSGTLAWSLASGALPAGLSLGSAGEISGTPTLAGTSDFSVLVSSPDGQEDEQALSVTVYSCAGSSCGGLEAWWRFEESTLTHGGMTSDASGWGRDGSVLTLEGAVDKSIGGQVGGAIQLDGSDDHVAIPDDSGLDLPGDFTLMAWINPDVILMNDWQALVSKNFDPIRPASLWLYGDTVEVWFTPQPDQVRARSTSTVSTGVWQHVAATFDDAAKEIRIYIDGALAGVTTGVLASPEVNAEPVVLGQRGDSRFYYDGGLDEVMIWSRVLSETEIQAYYDDTR